MVHRAGLSAAQHHVFPRMVTLSPQLAAGTGLEFASGHRFTEPPRRPAREHGLPFLFFTDQAGRGCLLRYDGNLADHPDR